MIISIIPFGEVGEGGGDSRESETFAAWIEMYTGLPTADGRSRDIIEVDE